MIKKTLPIIRNCLLFNLLIVECSNAINEKKEIKNVLFDTESFENVDYVEFYIDNYYQDIDYTEPFNWMWDKLSFGKSVIKSIVNDKAGIQESDSITVWKFF